LHDAAQLAAEAGVSLAADSPGTTPKPTEVDAMVKDALDRNLPGDAYTFSVAIPGQSAVPEYNIQVRVSEPFHASIAALTFTLGAAAAAKLGGSAASTLPPPSTPTPTPTPTPRPTPSPTAIPTSTPKPTPTPRISVTVSGVFYPASYLARNGWTCSTAAVGCYAPRLKYSFASGWSSAYFDTDGVNVGIGALAGADETHDYSVTVQWRSGVREVVHVIVTWPLDGRPYASSPYSRTVTRP
ncbi:MAG: hypothetical protein KGJ98_10895, partial [Chloroflexota bacterium]|nr:hypothetical protein [Chloroflexota bacterium]